MGEESVGKQTLGWNLIYLLKQADTKADQTDKKEKLRVRFCNYNITRMITSIKAKL